MAGITCEEGEPESRLFLVLNLKRERVIENPRYLRIGTKKMEHR